ncbi:MAG: FMN-binding protein [Bacteroidaceae bacterium]|nr:FMN-binding protein [Bacteroidaceae bacterium]
MNTNSNVYTICYAAVMVVLVAFLLAFVSSALKPAQDANVAIDKKKQILASLNVRGIAKSDVEAKYDELIQETYVLTPDGQQIEGADAFDVETKEIGEKFPIYLAKTAEGEDAYVLPLKGRGLWGGLWGYVALTLDCEKVLGAYFDHESETAGLGALIKEEKFQSQFIGRPVMADGKVALTVVKKGTSEAETQVDGVTGATLTSKGVGEMVQSGIKQYVDVVVKGIVGAISNPAGCGRHKGCQKHEGCGQHEGCQKHEGCGQHEGCQKHEGCGQHEGCQKHEGCDGCPEKAGAEAGHKCKSGNDCCKSGTCDKSGSCGKPGCDGDKACCGHR